MVKAQIYIEKNDLQLLKRFAAEEKISYAQKMRELIAEYLKVKTTQKKKIINWAEEAKKFAVPMGTIDIDKELYEEPYEEKRPS